MRLPRAELFHGDGDHAASRRLARPILERYLERERQLSPLFIMTPDYGTRSSTLILIDRENGVTFMERTFNNGTEEPKTVIYRFRATP